MDAEETPQGAIPACQADHVSIDNPACRREAIDSHMEREGMTDAQFDQLITESNMQFWAIFLLVAVASIISSIALDKICDTLRDIARKMEKPTE